MAQDEAGERLAPQRGAHLEAGDLPEDYHRFLLRQVRRLDADQIRLVDEHLAGVEIPSIPRSTFEAQVRLAVASVGNELKPPREAREVRIDTLELAARPDADHADFAMTCGKGTAIGTAIGVLVERHKITPDAAFTMLVRSSQRTNRKLRDIADDLLFTGELP